MCGGGSSAPPPPAPDPAQQDLEKQQLSLLKQQQQEQEAFAPLLAKQYGYNMTTDASGNISYTQDPVKAAQLQQVQDLQSQQLQESLTASQKMNSYLDSLNTPQAAADQATQTKLNEQNQQIALAQGEREQAALNGTLPISQGLQSQKDTEYQTLKENLARGGNSVIGDAPGTAYSLSSPGSEALKTFNQRWGVVEDQARQGQLDSGSQAYLGSVGLTNNIGSSSTSTLAGLSQPQGYAGTSSALQVGTTPYANNMSLVQGFGAAMQPYEQQQQMQFQTGLANANLQQQNTAGWLQAGGTLLGAGAGAWAASSKGMKKNISTVSKGSNSEKADHAATVSLVNTPVYKWNYKHEPNGAKKHLGTMTETAPNEVVTHDGKHLDIGSYLGLLTNSTKDLHRRLSLVEGRN